MIPAAQVHAGPQRHPAGRCRAAVAYALDGDLRFLSHHDELRMFTRALVRARWPLRFSEGFNPIPRVRLPLPRPVGTASDCQWALVELKTARPTAELHERLARALPAGCRLHRTIAPAAAGTPHPRTASYAVTLRPEDTRGLAERITRLMARKHVSVPHAAGRDGPPRPLDIRPYLETLVLDGTVLRMRLAYAAHRSARPSEILTALDLDAAAYAHRLRRVAVTWDMELTATGEPAVAPEGNTIGQEKDDEQEKAKDD